MGTRISNYYINGLSVVLFLSGLILGPTPATAASLSLVPSEQTVSLGSQVTVNVIFSDPAGTLVGTYDFFVNYNSEVLAFDPNDVAFGSGLGGPTDSIPGASEPQAGQISVAEISLVQDLTPLQDGTNDLLLFSVTFDTDMLGTSLLTFAGGINPDFDFLGDENGIAIALDNIDTGAITVVPIPAAVWLLGSALVGLLGSGLRLRRNATV